MAIAPIMLARLLANVHQTFNTALSVDIELVEGAKYGEPEQKIAADSINAINAGFEALINMLAEVTPKAEPAPSAETPAAPAPEAPAVDEVKSEEPAAEQ